MKSDEIDIHKELKKYFGFNQFKGLQEPVIRSLLARKNTFVIMPTGGGKSLCYQLPALMLKGTAIVVSPLIALMKNQVDAIRSLSSENGIAHVLNSSLTKTEIAQVKADILAGITKMLYVAPESLTKTEYTEFLQDNSNNYYQAGVFFSGESCGLGFRKGGKILDNKARFCGHLVVGK